jgi:hypothetical protein
MVAKLVRIGGDSRNPPQCDAGDANFGFGFYTDSVQFGNRLAADCRHVRQSVARRDGWLILWGQWISVVSMEQLLGRVPGLSPDDYFLHWRASRSSSPLKVFHHEPITLPSAFDQSVYRD